MKKAKKKSTQWFCKECGHESINYLGKCPSCNSWNTFTEAPSLPRSQTNRNISPSTSSVPSVCKLSEITLDEDSARIDSGFQEVNRVLGGGLQAGAFVLIGGEPGIGKSTLLLQTISNVATNHKVLYISAEESLSQVKGRADRLNINQNILFMSETNFESAVSVIDQEQPQLVVVDSIQAVYSADVDSVPGSPSQIRHCANTLMNIAKSQNISIILVGHITKDGTIAGPKILEHMVDVVLQFEGDKYNYYRILRGIKNRFGPTDEIGVFEMLEHGLAEITNPSTLFLSAYGKPTIGTIATATVQGSRVLLAELQALTGISPYPQPRRMVNGLDFNRVNQVIAILEKRINLPVSKHDIYTNVVGGLDIQEPSVDLAAALSVVSCQRNQPIDNNLIAIGEVGLTGEIRSIPKVELRIKEAARLGFTKAVIPHYSKKIELPNSSIQIIQTKNLYSAIKATFTD